MNIEFPEKLPFESNGSALQRKKNNKSKTMSNEQGIGAPKGGRVHWLLWCLGQDFKGAYKLYYNYAYHNYCSYRLDK